MSGDNFKHELAAAFAKAKADGIDAFMMKIHAGDGFNIFTPITKEEWDASEQARLESDRKAMRKAMQADPEGYWNSLFGVQLSRMIKSGEAKLTWPKKIQK